jgi:hypothetical protein
MTSEEQIAVSLFPELSTDTDLIPIRQAEREERLARQTIGKAIAAGRIKDRRGLQRCGDRAAVSHCRLVSRRECKAERARLDTNKPPPSKVTGPVVPDGYEPIWVLSRAFDVAVNTLKRWCEMESHPVLGRKAGCGFYLAKVTRKTKAGTIYEAMLPLQHMSRTDAEACATARGLESSERIGSNPGTWFLLKFISKGARLQGAVEGIFNHDNGKSYLTSRSAEKRAGLSENALSQQCYTRHLDGLKVLAPTPKGIKCIAVWSEESVTSRLKEWRSGRVDGGGWDFSNEIWLDSDGQKWISSILAEKKRPGFSFELAELREKRIITKFKRVPRDPGDNPKRRNRGGSIGVFHISEIGPLIGIPASEGAPAPIQETHAQPLLSPFEKHLTHRMGARKTLLALLWDDGKTPPRDLGEVMRTLGYKRVGFKGIKETFRKFKESTSNETALKEGYEISMSIPRNTIQLKKIMQP